MIAQERSSKTIMMNRFRPKIVQEMCLDALCKYMYVVVHRQYGKTELAYKISESRLLKKYPPSPHVAIAMPTIVQCEAVYLDRFRENFQKGFDTSYDKKTLRMKRSKYGDARVEFFGSDRFSDSDRGRTSVFAVGDEYGSFPKGFYQQNIAPFTDVYDAPNFLTGTTSRGPNHFKKELEDAIKRRAAGDKDYFGVKWTIEDSLKYGEISQEQYDKIRKRYDTPEYQHIWRGEYMMDWYAYLQDQIYGVEISQARDEGRIGYFPYDFQYPVDTFWDIGRNGTAVWFRQSIHNKHIYIKFIDDTEKVHMQSFFVKHILPLRNKYNFRYHIFPHDMGSGEFMSKETRIQVARKILPGESFVFNKTRTSKVLDLVDYTRRHFERCFFDDKNCEQGIERLGAWQMKNGKPDKEQASHGSDAFTLAENCSDFYEFDKYKEDLYRTKLTGQRYIKPGRPKKNWWIQ